MKITGWRRMGMIVFATVTMGVTRQAHAEQTAPLVFVTEFVRELSANENARANAEQDMRESTTTNDKLSNAVHASTLIELELRSQIEMLKGLNLDPPFDELVPTIMQLYERKIELHQKMIDTIKAFLRGQEPNVDYGGMAAEMPEVRASLDDMDHTLFKLTPMAFLMLIDQKPDSKNHLSHLVITKAEREKLINDIKIDFGEKLEQKNSNYIVSSAKLIEEMLLKDYKCADDPWE